MIKAHVSKVVLAVLDRTIQVCGALGYSSDLPVESWYRSTRFGPIGDGPDELHKSVLARTLLKKLLAGRGLADRAHPQPPSRGRGEVGRAAYRGGRLVSTSSVSTVREHRLGGSSTTRSGDRVPLTVDADGRRRLVRGVRRRPGRRALGAAARAAARQLRHRARRAPRVPHPRRDQGHRCRIARPVVACDDPSVFGAPFYVMERIDGVPDPRGHVPDAWAATRDARRALRGADRRPRRDPRRRLACRAALEDLGHPEAIPRRARSPRWLGQLDSYGGRELPAARDLAGWLDAHRPADQPPALCHGDYKLDNVLFAPTARPPAGRRRLGDGRDRRSARRPRVGADLPSRARTADAPRHHEGARSSPSIGCHRRPRWSSATRSAPGATDRLAWYDVFARWKLAIVLEGSYAKFQRGESDKPIHEFFGYQADLLLTDAARRI